MIEIGGVSYTYRTGKEDAVPALHGVSLKIEPGQLVAIIGYPAFDSRSDVVAAVILGPGTLATAAIIAAAMDARYQRTEWTWYPVELLPNRW